MHTPFLQLSSKLCLVPCICRFVQTCREYEEKKQAKDAEKADADTEEDEEESSKPSEEDCKKYGTFWTNFGKAIKLGIIEDTTNRNRLAKLLRVQTSKSDGKLISLDEYVARMKEGQKEIYFISGASWECLQGEGASSDGLLWQWLSLSLSLSFVSFDP